MLTSVKVLLFQLESGVVDPMWLLLLVGAGAAIALGAFALSKAKANPAQFGGRGLAMTGIVTGVAAAALILTTYFIYREESTPAGGYYAQQNPPSAGSSNGSVSANAASNSSYNYGANSAPTPSYGNYGGYSPTPPAYDYNSSGSGNMNGSSSMSEDEKYRIFYAASQTGDRMLMLQVGKQIGLVDAGGNPTAYYQTFLSNTMAWAQRDTAFPPQVNTPEKARAYVMANLQSPRP